jgi:16S rRNA (guanine527-N7)-methyltransferase
VDVGSGAGLPGIPLAIVRNDLRVTLLEPDGRRAAFLELAAGELDLKTPVLAVTAEAAGRGEQRESFDLAVARAVAPLAVSCELTLPLVRVGGRALLLKGPSVAGELGEGRRAARLLGGADPEMSAWTLKGGERRILVVIRKDHPTPQAYPRRTGLPRRRPLKG